MPLAQNSINLIVMNLLWAFNFDFAKDPATGTAIPIDIDKFQEGLVLLVEPFQCSIKPRGRAQTDIIRSQFANARSTFARFEYDLGESETAVGHDVGYQW